MPNKKIKKIQLSGETYDIAVDGIDKVDGLNEKLALFSNSTSFPNDQGEIKTKYRVSLKVYTGETSNNTRYYKLATFPINNANNYASLLISGRLGGWTSEAMTSINAIIWNRGTPGIAIISLNSGGVSATNNIWNNCDLELYVDSSSITAAATATLYLKCYSYFTFDLDLKLFQESATIDYDETYTTIIPSGVIAAKASTSPNKLELNNGNLKVGEKSTLLGSWDASTGILTLDTSSLNK